MPVIPQFQVSPTQVPAPPELPRANPAGWSSPANAMAEGADRLSNVMLQFQQRYVDARRATDAATAVANGANQLGELQQKWSKVPDRDAASRGFAQEAGLVQTNILNGLKDPLVRAHVQGELARTSALYGNETQRLAFQTEGSANQANLMDQLQKYQTQYAAAGDGSNADAIRANLRDQAQAAIKGGSAAGWWHPAEGERMFLSFAADTDYTRANQILDRARESGNVDAVRTAWGQVSDPNAFPYLSSQHREMLTRRADYLIPQVQAKADAVQSNALAYRAAGLAPGATLTDFVREHEGLRLATYDDGTGTQTIGYGHTGPDVQPGQTITPARADTLLSQDLAKAAADVNRLVTVPLTSNQRDALTSFQFNTGGLEGSTLLEKLNAGDTAGAAAEFDNWNKAKTGPGSAPVPDPGLTARRAAERQMFEGGVSVIEPEAAFARLDQLGQRDGVSPQVMTDAYARLNHVLNVRNQTLKTQQADLSASLNDRLAALRDGQTVAEPDWGQYTRAFGASAVADMRSQWGQAQSIGQVQTALRWATPDQVNNAIKTASDALTDPTATDYQQHRAYLQVVLTVAQAREQQLAADPAAYAAQAPTVQAAQTTLKNLDPKTTPPDKLAEAQQAVGRALITVQTGLGVADPHVLPQPVAQEVARQLMGMPAEQQPQQLLALRQQWGGLWPVVWRDLATNGKLPPGYQTVAVLASEPTTLATASELSAVLAMRANSEQWEKVVAGIPSTTSKGAAANDIKTTVAADSIWQSFSRSLATAGANPVQIENMLKAATDMAMYRAWRGKDWRSTVSDLFGNYEYLPDGGNARVPATQYDAVVLATTARKRNLTTSDIQVPAWWISQGRPAESYVDGLRASGIWINDPAGGAVLLKDALGKTVFDSTGQPIRVPFTDRTQ